MRVRAYLVGAVLLGATIYPVFLDPVDDDYPLSTYPMFSRDRGKVAHVVRAVVVDADGAERRVPPAFVSNSEAMQVVQTLQRTFRAGRKESRRLCRAIAGRIRASGDPALTGAERVELQTLAVNAVQYLTSDREPLSRRVHARCPLSEGG